MTTTRLARLDRLDERERICQDRDDAYRGVPEEIDRLLCLLRQWGEARLAADEYRDRNWKQIERLEWFGGLYTQQDATGKEVVVQPTAKVRKCLINTAKISKLGKSLERALSFGDLNVPLLYDGPSDIEKLFQEERFHSRLSVGLNNKRVMRVRPKFFPWGLELHGVFIEDAGINYDEFLRIVELAGVVEGIGDARAIGYGRFEAEVTKL